MYRKHDEELLERLRRDLPHYGTNELVEKYHISKRTVAKYREVYGIPVSEELAQRLKSKALDACLEAKRAMSKEDIKRMIANSQAARAVTVEKEKKRLIMGLEQKTKMKLSLDRKHTRFVNMTRARIVKRNNYFFFKEDNRTLYYDNDTIRSEYIEKYYGHIFKFIPSEDYDPSRPKFRTKKYKI